MLIRFVGNERNLPGPFAWLAVFGLVCVLAGSSTAFACESDAECDDGSACNGVEWCDVSGGIPGFCTEGLPVVCDDSDPCTVDFCVEPTGSCDNITTTDNETSFGLDGICDTADDNIELYGIDGTCGTGDDTTGDGYCDLLDNCANRSNPGQEDADQDGLGDACDPTPCKVWGLYAFNGGSLVRVDPATGDQIFVGASFTNPKDVAVNATETQAVVTSTSNDTIYVVDLEDPTFELSWWAPGPWGIDYNDSSTAAYLAGNTSGDVYGFDPLEGSLFTTTSSTLGDPTGLDVNAAETLAYIAQESAGMVSSVDLVTGVDTMIAGGLASPTDLVLNPAETDLYVIEAGLGQLTAVDISTGVATTIASGLVDPQGLALNAAGTIAYVNEGSTGWSVVSEVDLATGVVTPMPSDEPEDSLMTNGGLAPSPRPPVVLTVPDGTLGIPSATVTVPVNVDDVTGLGILSIDFDLGFNPAIITPTSVVAGTLTSGCTLTDNLTVPGAATVSVFCASPLSGAGSIAEIDFNVGGARGQGSPILVTSVLINEGMPAVCGDAGSFEVPVGIDGTVLYYRDEATSTEPSTQPVDAADVDLGRFDWNEHVYTTVGSTSTDCSGNYSFSSLPPVLTYRVTPSKAADFEGAIDPYDAALNAQHVVGLTTLTANQSLAADVTGNGALTSYDSAHIAQFSVSLITQFPVATLNGSDWTFVPAPQAEPNQSTGFPYPSAGQPGSIEYQPITESAESQDFHAILYGDVSGNWTGVCGEPAAKSASSERYPAGSDGEEANVVGHGRAKSQGLVSLPNLRAARGEEILVPIRVDGVAEAIAFLFDLRYDPAVLELLGTEVGGDAGSFQLQANNNEDGRARLAMFSASPLGGDGELAHVRFRVIGDPRSRTDLTLATSRVNEGRIPVTVREGRVVVSSKPLKP